MKYLSKNQIVKMHCSLINNFGGIHGIRDEGLLDSAINSPFQTFDSIDLYPTIVEKAVRLGYCLITNHPFIDGNKRIGAHAMLVFLDINNIFLDYDEDEFVSLIVKVASSQINYQQLLYWIITHITINLTISCNNI